jgi:hypothetical protein
MRRSILVAILTNLCCAAMAVSQEAGRVPPWLREMLLREAAQLTPYPMLRKPEGVIFAGMPEVEPPHLAGDKSVGRQGSCRS